MTVWLSVSHCFLRRSLLLYCTVRTANLPIIIREMMPLPLPSSVMFDIKKTATNYMIIISWWHLCVQQKEYLVTENCNRDEMDFYLEVNVGIYYVYVLTKGWLNGWYENSIILCIILIYGCYKAGCYMCGWSNIVNDGLEYISGLSFCNTPKIISWYGRKKKIKIKMKIRLPEYLNATRPTATVLYISDEVYSYFLLVYLETENKLFLFI